MHDGGLQVCMYLCTNLQILDSQERPSFVVNNDIKPAYLLAYLPYLPAPSYSFSPIVFCASSAAALALPPTCPRRLHRLILHIPRGL